MAENTERKAVNEQDLRNNLQAALNQIRVLTQKNQELGMETQSYRISDFYQRIGWLWTFIKEDITEPDSPLWKEFKQKCVEDLDKMMFPDIPENSEKVDDKN